MQTRQSPNRETLIRLALHAGISEPTHLSKVDLFHQLQSGFNFERLMRAEIRRSCEESKSLKRKRNSSNSDSPIHSAEDDPIKKCKLNRLDPIMLAPIGKKKTFKFSRPNGTQIQFNVDSLIDYLLTTGDFHDPETRIPFSDEDLRGIDNIAKEIGLAKSSVYEAKNNAALYSDAKFRRDALLALERCAGDVIAEMLEVAESYDPDDAQMELVLRHFPVFQDYYRQMKQADTAYASKCLAHWHSFIKGPPNHPNEDDYGFIRIIINFLKTCDQGNSA